MAAVPTVGFTNIPSYTQTIDFVVGFDPILEPVAVEIKPARVRIRDGARDAVGPWGCQIGIATEIRGGGRKAIRLDVGRVVEIRQLDDDVFRQSLLHRNLLRI